MKVRDRKQLPPVYGRFTDRKEPRRIFWEHYQKMKSRPQDNLDIQVLSYYGIGGIGKSALLRKLVEELEKKVFKPGFLYFDLGVVHDSKEVLEGFRNKLSEEAHFSFALFDLAMYTYARKVGKNFPAPQISALASKNPILSTILEVGQMLPGVGVFAKVAEMADKGIAFARNLLRKYRREIAELDQMPQELLEKRLPYYFALNMAENLQNRKEPFVIFLDTYEKMVNEVSSIGEPLYNDLWLRSETGLIQNIPNVLWVIAGREKLRWTLFDNAWESALEQHMLDSLSYKDTFEYLEVAGLHDKKLIDKIYELTHGTPVYLELCINRFFSISENTIPIAEDFGVNTHMLIERYVRYMNDSSKDIVYLFSCLGTWEEELFLEIANKIIPNFSITSYEKVKSFSFISKSSKKFYTIHQTVAEVLFQSCPKLIKRRTIKYALEYYLEKLKKDNLYSERLSYDLRMAVHFSLLKYPNNDEYFYFFKKELSNLFIQLIEACRFSLINNVFDPIYKRAIQCEQTPLCALSYRVMARFLMFEGKYNESFIFAKKSTELFTHCLGKTHQETLESNFQLGSCLLKQGRYKEAYACSKFALEHSKRNFGEKHSLSMKLESLFAGSLSLLGEHENAYRIYQRVLNKRIELLGEMNPDTVRAMSNIATTLGELGRYEEAFEMRKEVLKKRRKFLGADHPDTMREMEHLARAYGSLGRYKEAVLIRETVLKKQQKLLGEDHPETIRTMNSLGITLHALGQYKKSLLIKEEVLKKRKNILGETHPDTIRAAINLADLLCTLERYEEAFLIREDVLEKRRKILGEEHPDTIRSKEYLASSLDDLHRHEEALVMHREVLEKHKILLGEEHPDTIRELNAMVKNFYALGKVQEALPYAQQLYDKLKDQVVNHYRRILWLDTVARIFAEVGRFEEAKKISKQNIMDAEEKYKDVVDYMRDRYQTMGIIYAKCGQHKEAQKYFKKAKRKSKKNP